MRDIINAYGEVLPNLEKHEQGWPSVLYLLDRVKSGLPVYGMDGVGSGKDSDGSELLISAVDASEEDLWVTVWGGSSVLAQSLYKVQSERTESELAALVKKLHVYPISDQDNSGTWIRRSFPQLFYIASIHQFLDYGSSAWQGISGEHLHHYEGGPDSSVITAEWIKKNIQSVSVLGSKCPDFMYLVEGDTPSFLYLIPNGLSDPTRPQWGSWGGRYGAVNLGEGLHSDSLDTVIGVDGKQYTSNAATVWRWRRTFQNDFAARMRWTATDDFSQANHAPVAVVNGSCSLSPIDIDLALDEIITMDATSSYDPDVSTTLSFQWWQYLEASGGHEPSVPKLVLKGAEGSKLQIALPPREVLNKNYRPEYADGDRLKRDLHVILEVSHGELTSYRRIVVHIDILGSLIRGKEQSVIGHSEL
ncbi:hypothetical protein F5884DRAFT_805461 [Xylogone sp. PMI_703]|nr:hypothetical protein F5884DRAFT_805461 [Xylogone sp. PMI_703]